MVTSDFRPEVDIRLFSARAMKNTQYNSYLWPYRRHFLVVKEIGVDEHDDDVTFWTGSGNMAVSCMRSAFGQEQLVHCGYAADSHVPQNAFL